MFFCSLPANPSDNLDWKQEIQKAREHASSGSRLLWEIDFRLSMLQWIPEDSSLFFSLSLAIEEFTKNVLPEFVSETEGVILYRGDGDFQKCFPQFRWEASFEAWKEDLKLIEDDYPLFTTQLTSEWLHRLVSAFPEELRLGIVIDNSNHSSFIRKEQLFSKERFRNIEVLSDLKEWENRKELPTLGVCLPQDTYLNETIRKELDLACEALKKTKFRVIPEGILTEEWEGLDELIVIRKGVSREGRRKLAGFEAAGGTVTTIA